MRIATFLLVVVLAFDSHADAPRVIDAARLRVGDVVTGAPAAAAAVDLGPAPPPGGTRLLGRSEILDALKRAGVDSSRLRVAPSVRVTGASKVLEPDQIAILVRPMIEAGLNKGVALLRVEAPARITVSPRSAIRSVKLAPVPRQKGIARVSAFLEWACDDRVTATGNVSVTVDVSAEAAAPDVVKGASLMLVIERNRVQVSAPGLSLGDAMIGQVVRASVRSTSRVVSARVVARDRAMVVEHP